MKKSHVKIVVKGLNQERAFNNLVKEVQILKLDRQDKHQCTLEVYPKDVKKVKKFLTSNNFEIVSVASQGLHAGFKRFLSCYGVLAGLVLCIVGYLAQSQFIWQIKVYGNESLSSNEICRYIESSLSSRYIPKVQTKDIEIGLKENFNRLSSVSVAIVGQSLVVNINEAVVPEEMAGNFQRLVSGYDCLITEIELVQGTLAVKVGDVVRVGQTLVEPYVIDSQGQRREVKPIATIKADVWLVGASEHSESFYKTYRTGKVIETSEVSLFGLPIYSNSKPIAFKQYETVTSVQNLNKNNLLPFKITKTKYYETKTELIEKTFDEVKEQIIENARQKALQNLESCEIIKSEDVTISGAAGVYLVNYVVTVNREILGGEN